MEFHKSLHTVYLLAYVSTENVSTYLSITLKSLASGRNSLHYYIACQFGLFYTQKNNMHELCIAPGQAVQQFNWRLTQIE